MNWLHTMKITETGASEIAESYLKAAEVHPWNSNQGQRDLPTSCKIVVVTLFYSYWLRNGCLINICWNVGVLVFLWKKRKTLMVKSARIRFSILEKGLILNWNILYKQLVLFSNCSRAGRIWKEALPNASCESKFENFWIFYYF